MLLFILIGSAFHVSTVFSKVATQIQSHISTLSQSRCRALPGAHDQIFVCMLNIPPPLRRCDPTRAMASSFLRFLDHAQRRITVGRTLLDEWSVRRRDLYLTTLTTNKHPCRGGIRTHDLSRRAAADLRLRPRGHRDQLKIRAVAKYLPRGTG